MFTRPIAGSLALVVGMLAGAAGNALAQQTVIVEKNARLRRDPSSTHKEIRTLAPGQELDLLDTAKVNKYYHVVLAESHDTGWVWAATVKLDTDQLPDTTAAGVTPATSIDPSWTHPAPVSGTFASPVSNRTCGAVGSPGDSATNRRKNRTDVPQSYHAVEFSAIADLPYPASKSKDRTQWPPESLAVIQRFEGAAVTVVGYLVAIKPQTGNSESTNCLMTQAAETDWHVALVEHQGDGEASSIVVETTPRTRIHHPRWTVARLNRWVDSHDPVRISGWLLFDPSHRNHLGRYRTTLWEVHPITRIEVWTAGKWVDFDSLP